MSVFVAGKGWGVLMRLPVHSPVPPSYEICGIFSLSIALEGMD